MKRFMILNSIWILELVIVFLATFAGNCVSPVFADLHSQFVLVDKQHVDIEVPLIGGNWNPFINAWYDGNLSPDKAVLHLNENTQTVRSQWESWTGAADGDTVWVAEQGSVPGELYLGFAARGCDGLGTWMPDDSRLSIPYQYIQINLVDVRGYDGAPAPGEFSLWNTDGYGNKTVWFSTAEEPGDGNRTYMYPGGHAHFSWGFTAKGIYEIDLQTITYLGPGQTNMTVSPVTTFYFGVESPIPGDANFDEKVDEIDATIMAVNWSCSGGDLGWFQGDFNFDQTVDELDAAIIAEHWLVSLDDVSASAATVPEPSMAIFLCIGLAIIVWLKR